MPRETIIRAALVVVTFATFWGLLAWYWNGGLSARWTGYVISALAVHPLLPMLYAKAVPVVYHLSRRLGELLQGRQKVSSTRSRFANDLFLLISAGLVPTYLLVGAFIGVFPEPV